MLKCSFKKLVFAATVGGLTLGVQTVGIQRPFLGHYASYQATVMASIARNMIRENFSEPFLPKTDIIIGQNRSLHLNQYPFPSVLAALGSRFLGGGLEFWGRFQAIFFNFFSALLMAQIGTRLFNARVGWMSAGIFALSPFSLIYGQCFMSESFALFCLLAALACLLPLKKTSLSAKRIVTAAVLFSVALAGRIHFVLFYPVYFACIFFNPNGQPNKKYWLHLFLFGSISCILPALWYGHTYWVGLKADNIHTSLFLQVSSQDETSWRTLTRFDFYRSLFDTVSQMILTPLIFPFLFLGFVGLEKRSRSFVIVSAALVFGLLVLVLVPEKVMKHDFYLYGAFPFMVFFAACGIELLLNASPVLNTTRTVFFSLLLYFFVSSRFFLHPIFNHGKEGKNLKAVINVVHENTKSEDRVIVAGNDIGSAMYYVNRPGWPLQFPVIGKPLSAYLKNTPAAKANPGQTAELETAMQDAVTWLEYLHRQGASYFLIPNAKELKTFPTLERHLKRHYQLLSSSTDDFYLFKLAPRN